MGTRVPAGDRAGFALMTLQELMALPPADRALAVSLALKSPMPQAEGAWPAGTRVRKCNSPPGDFHEDGALAMVVGSTRAPGWVREMLRREHGREVSCFYLVVFDDLGIPVAVLDDRLELVAG